MLSGNIAVIDMPDNDDEDESSRMGNLLPILNSNQQLSGLPPCL